MVGRAVPNADQTSSAHPWDKPARSPFSSACGANTERAEEGDTEVAGRGLRSDGIFSFSVLASGKVFGVCFRSVIPSGKLHLQKPSVPPSSVPSVFRAASRFSKESSLTDRHSGQSPARRAKGMWHEGSCESFHALNGRTAAKGLAALPENMRKNGLYAVPERFKKKSLRILGGAAFSRALTNGAREGKRQPGHAERSWRAIGRMESARAFAPLREGGAARRKMACGLRVRSGRTGRRGEYCGRPSRQAFAWSIRGGIVLSMGRDALQREKMATQWGCQVKTLSFAWWGWPVGADLRAARHGLSFRTACPEVGPYRREHQTRSRKVFT